MRDKIVACLLSVTLVVSSVVPSGFAFAEPEDIYVEQVDIVSLIEEGSVDDGVSNGDSASSGDELDRLSSGVLLGEELEEVNEEEPVVEESVSTYANTRAIPAVVAWLASTIGGTAIGYGIEAFIDSIDGDNAQENMVALLYGIQSTLVDSSGFNYISLISGRLSTLIGLIDNVESLLDDLGYYISILCGHANNLNTKMDTLISLTDGSVAYYLSVLAGHLNTLNLHIDQDVEYYLSVVAGHLNAIRTSYGEDIPAILEALDKISSPDIEVSVPDIVVNVDVGSQIVDGSSFMEDVFGTLDTVALASELASLTQLLEKAFPFCLVFGLVAIVELLVAPADAPSFDFPLSDGSGGTFLYTVDLEAFDPAAGVFRGMITIIYIIGLIRLTNTFVFKGGSE